MADDKSKTGREDSSRVNINEDYEIQYWTKKWGVTAQQLIDTVKRVGPMVNDVQRALGK